MSPPAHVPAGSHYSPDITQMLRTSHYLTKNDYAILVFIWDTCWVCCRDACVVLMYLP